MTWRPEPNLAPTECLSMKAVESKANHVERVRSIGGADYHHAAEHTSWPLTVEHVSRPCRVVGSSDGGPGDRCRHRFSRVAHVPRTRGLAVLTVFRGECKTGRRNKQCTPGRPVCSQASARVCAGAFCVRDQMWMEAFRCSKRTREDEEQSRENRRRRVGW